MRVPLKINSKNKPHDLYVHIIGGLENIWKKILASHNEKYESAQIILFDTQVSVPVLLSDNIILSSYKHSAKQGAVYNHADNKIYLPTSLDEELENKLSHTPKTNYNFAIACVVAHEFGHHIQQLVGGPPALNRLALSGNFFKANNNDFRQHIEIELDADYLAGVWAHHARADYNIVEDGDIDTAKKLFYYAGNDQESDEPQYFTYGTSEQRVENFLKGLKEGSKHLRL